MRVTENVYRDGEWERKIMENIKRPKLINYA